MNTLKETKKLLKVVHLLRKKCPWDSRQTHKSLAPHLLEEAYETLEAIRKRDGEKLKEELGDVLLQVVLHSELAKEKGLFSFEDIAKVVSDKMIRRHPHIWKKDKKDLKNHMKIWTSIKSSEKNKEHHLTGIPIALPSLQLSARYGEIAASVGFDWDSHREVFKKVTEEIRELKKELDKKRLNKRLISSELGDIFFVLANLCRHLKINAEEAAKMGALKFLKRFSRMEKLIKKKGKKLHECSMYELEIAWKYVKRIIN